MEKDTGIKTDFVLGIVHRELLDAQEKFPPMNSPHEAYAVILKEVEEFWEAIRTKGVSPAEAQAELVQVAAMAIRAIVDLY